LSFKQLDSIFSSTRNCGGNSIGKWGDVGVNGTLADKDINIYGITPWNGFEEFVRQKVLSCGGKRGECKCCSCRSTKKPQKLINRRAFWRRYKHYEKRPSRHLGGNRLQRFSPRFRRSHRHWIHGTCLCGQPCQSAGCIYD
jgi:hypothetical protein